MPDTRSTNMPRGVGVDLVRIERIAGHIRDERFLKRLFTARELEDVGRGPQRAARLAARWAAKEAFAKALGCGFGESLTWGDVEVVRQENGSPILRLSQRALQQHGNLEALVSLSHDGEYAIAVVWLGRPSGGTPE